MTLKFLGGGSFIFFLWLVNLAVFVAATSACQFFLWSHSNPTEIANIWKSVC